MRARGAYVYVGASVFVSPNERTHTCLRKRGVRTIANCGRLFGRYVTPHLFYLSFAESRKPNRLPGLLLLLLPAPLLLLFRLELEVLRSGFIAAA